MNPRLFQIMLDVSKSPLIDAGQQHRAIRLVLDSVCEGLQVQRAGVWFFDATNQHIRCELLLDRAHNTESEDIVLTERDYPLYFAALMSERAIVAHDACQDPNTSEFRQGYLEPLGVTSMMDVPIRHQGRMIGIICCEHCGPKRTWSADEVTFASGLGDLVGRAINARVSQTALQALEVLNNQLELRVQERTRALSESHDELKDTLAQLQLARAAMVHSEKMAALGSLVAGIAHELNTPIGNSLTVITTLSHDLNNLVAAEHEGRLRRSDLLSFLDRSGEAAQLLERNIGRANDLITNFKQIAVDQTSDQRRHFELAAFLQELMATLRAGASARPFELSADVPQPLPFDSYPGALGQVLQNLVNNAAAHAFEPEAHGLVRVGVVHLPSDWVQITVQDNGRGIAPEVLPRIFDPFFTTRLGQGGSGLGLHITHNLVTQLLGGRIEVHSQIGTGTAFLITIPCTAPAAPATAGKTTTPTPNVTTSAPP